MAGASAQSFLMTYGGRTMAVGTPQTDDTARSNGTYTFTVDIGVETPSRRVFFAIHWVDGSGHRQLVPANCSINAQAIEYSLQEGHDGGLTGFGAAIISGKPTGSGSVTLVVDFEDGGGANRVGGATITPIITHGLTGSAAVDTSVETSSLTAVDLSGTIATEAGGLLILVYTGSTNTKNTTVSITGADEVYDTQGADHSNAPGDPVRVALGVATNLASNGAYALVVDLASNVPDAGNAYVAESWI